ncbi:hypothetical protein [Streptomyces sp. NPDC097610]|uniref:hypothetical protein n=1 Tax=Streptomyces sp. NPDC097610 TaxID=3157227 RepID=UPI0033185858
MANHTGWPEPKHLIKGLQRTVYQAKASGPPSIVLTGACLGENADLYVAVDAAASQGLLVVVPDGDGDGGENMDAFEYSPPAGASGTFTVAASPLTDQRAHFVMRITLPLSPRPARVGLCPRMQRPIGAYVRFRPSRIVPP